jgi:hypothetical protein
MFFSYDSWEYISFNKNYLLFKEPINQVIKT